ncbi:NfeD family protein [Bermanella marisrubri]|uniref:NfeD-like C-terminal domain-containing protein n=1 Tax=Bermanella marisrubri TaxID=207949 RepID=Q1N486_9GAMM|nr:hypothetical protein [Bermanella marisrubri]EAT12979.1 hypothetical protein RED65_14822 [Oceanobacter sp. RED65] [Bermanella marisrubri]QIZ82893.1 NfeD family protein [Bermanella marisrubri]
MGFLENIAQSLVISGLLILIIDAMALGFATFILTFFGVALMLTGLLMYIDIIPQTWNAALWSAAIITPIVGVILWKPLKRLQNQVSKEPVNSDFAEIEFELEEDVDSKGLTLYRYSGVDWKLKSQQPIAKGKLVRVVKKDVGAMWVEAVE